MVGADIPESTESKTGIRRSVLLATALFGTFIYTAANAFLSGGLGPAGRTIGLTEIEVGSILSAGALAGVVSAPVWGYAAERWSRRFLMLIAIPVVTAAPAAMALVFGNAAALPLIVVMLLLLAARLVQAAFGAALIPVAQSYVAQFTSPGRRVAGMGVLSLALSFGGVSGSAILWLTARFGIIAGFSLIATIAALAFVFALLLLPEAPPPPAAMQQERAVPLRRIWPNLAVTFLGFAAYTIVQPILGFRFMDRFGEDAAGAAAHAGMALTAGALAVLGAQVLVAARRTWSATTMLRAGSACAVVGVAAVLLAWNTAGIVLAMVAVGIALGFMAPANLAAISLATGAGAQGKVGGINMAARSLGVAAGPIVGTAFYRINPDAPFYAAIAIVAVVLVLSFVGGQRPATAGA